MVVNLEDIAAHRALRRQINSVPIGSIVWKRNGEVVPIEQEVLEAWLFIGLSNAYFGEQLLDPKDS